MQIYVSFVNHEGTCFIRQCDACLPKAWDATLDGIVCCLCLQGSSNSDQQNDMLSPIPIAGFCVSLLCLFLDTSKQVAIML